MSGTITPGHRRPDGTPLHRLGPGEYARQDPAGSSWWGIRDPAGHCGSLANHAVTEHEDGTITASPSILIDAGACGSWHGFLDRGQWREC